MFAKTIFKNYVCVYIFKRLFARIWYKTNKMKRLIENPLAQPNLGKRLTGLNILSEIRDVRVSSKF